MEAATGQKDTSRKKQLHASFATLTPPYTARVGEARRQLRTLQDMSSLAVSRRVSQCNGDLASDGVHWTFGKDGVGSDIPSWQV